MWAMKYKCECIENMEWVESYKFFIYSKQTTALKSLLPTTIDWIKEIMKLITCNAQKVKQWWR